MQAAYEQRIKELGVQITALWDRLKVEDAVRDEWLSQHTGVGQAVVDAVRGTVAAQLCALWLSHLSLTISS